MPANITAELISRVWDTPAIPLWPEEVWFDCGNFTLELHCDADKQTVLVMAVIPAPDATMERVAKLERWGPFRLQRDGQGNVCAELTISVVGGLSDTQLVGFLTHTRHAIQGIYEDFHASTSTEPVPDTPAHMPVTDAYVTELITTHLAQEFGAERFVSPTTTR